MSVAELEKALDDSIKSEKMPIIKKNKKLLASLQDKIKELKHEIKERSSAAPQPKSEPKKQVASKQAPEKKQEPSVKKAEKTTPAASKVKVEKGQKSVEGFSIGDSVTWIERKTGDKLKGSIIKFSTYNDKPVAQMQTKSGAKWTNVDKLSKA